MGPWARPPLTDLSPRRIALLKPSALGDIVHSLPVLAALRRRFPAAHLTWIVNSGYRSLLEGHPDLDAILPFDRGAVRGGLRKALASYAGFFKELRRRRFDLVIDLQGLLRTGIMALASGAPSASAWPAPAKAHAGSTPTSSAFPTMPARTLSIATGGWRRLSGLPVPRCRFTCRYRPWPGAGPGTAWPAGPGRGSWWGPARAGRPSAGRRRISPAWRGWRRSADGGTVVLVGGGDERLLSQQVKDRLAGPHLDLTGQTTLPQLSAVLACADLMIANDTGPLHLAVALGRPVVAPYTCTKVQRTGPYQLPGSAIESSVWCQGSYLKRCPRLECMAELTPERLWPLVEEVLERWSRTTVTRPA